MPKIFITPSRETEAVNLINEWTEPKITWKLVVEILRGKWGLSDDDLGYRSLYKHPDIKSAFQVKQANLRAERDDPSPQENEPTVEVLLKEVTRLESEKAKLVEDYRKLGKQLLTWQSNAYGQENVDLRAVAWEKPLSAKEKS